MNFRFFARRAPRAHPADVPARRRLVDVPGALQLAGALMALAGIDRYSRTLSLILAGVLLAGLGFILDRPKTGGARGSR